MVFRALFKAGNIPREWYYHSFSFKNGETDVRRNAVAGSDGGADTGTRLHHWTSDLYTAMRCGPSGPQFHNCPKIRLIGEGGLEVVSVNML